MKIRPKIYPTDWAWAFIGFGLMWFLIGSGWSVSQAKHYQLELAEYKLAVGSALSQVQEVSNTLEKVSNNSAIAREQKKKIEELTLKTDVVLQQVQNKLENDTQKLIHLDPE